ncbi:glycosyltransferase family 31 protein [Amniculicola lignicola CBS 123094]|uniref:Glycosyltransferase family 31 protein n=1 Tax=Amniculicola lignicola CBS 123094 TaxID=1392246 RepID=A0A6A5W744_9PLEO|nr:glycosyltransferase family 31 protein [Amniculicola lignicola CBS 123094]
MVRQGFPSPPEAQWLVFVELHMIFVWRNLLQYLLDFRSKKPLHIGIPMMIGDVLFGYGGAGFILSQPAIKKVVEHWRLHQDDYETYAVEQWAGDMVLGRAPRDIDMPLFNANPNV